jgi:hypothetical protein
MVALTPGDNADGRNEGDDDDDGWEPVKPITSPYDRFLGYWGLRRPIAYTAGGGGGGFLVLTQHLITW